VPEIKLLILGLDGATFDIIDKFDSNELPCLNSLITQGVRGTLESTYPPVTGPAWTAMATGKNPGKTGVFGFRSRTTKDNFNVKMVTSAIFRQARSWWDYLSQVTKVAIWNYPVLYPPYPINGFMISGFGCSPDSQFTYPKALREELLHTCSGYKIEIPYAIPSYVNNPSLFIKDIMKLLDQNEKAIHLVLNKDIDAFIGVISATDFVQHYMWKFIDSKHPLYDHEMSEIYKPAFTEIWRRIDGIIETIIDKAGEHTKIVIVSDHGFGPHYQSFYVNSWLESKGYLARRRSVALLLRVTVQSTALKAIDRLKGLSPRVSETLKKEGSKYATSFLSQIDMQKTIAFANAHAINSGQIYLNMTPQEEQSKTRIRQQIADDLRNYCYSLGLKVNVYFPEQLYSGEFVDLAPDLLFDVNDFECSVHFKFSNSIYKNVPHNPGHSGSHKKEGIFIAYGPDIKQGYEIRGAKIYDVAPTILHMFGLPVPDDMDGRVLKEIFREGSEPARREVKFHKVDVERERVKDRIRKLKK
jgi:predicted AlkP superfamily phosphohydrolase/phosphomutase